MWLIKIHLHGHSYMLLLLRKYHPHISTHSISRTTQKNILLLIRERIAKNISVFPCEINAQDILLLPLAILSQDMSALKKREKEIRGNKKGQVPGTLKKKKKRDLREKKKYRASHSRHKVSKSKEGMYPLKRAKVELGFHHYYHHHHHMPFIRHTCTS